MILLQRRKLDLSMSRLRRSMRIKNSRARFVDSGSHEAVTSMQATRCQSATQHLADRSIGTDRFRAKFVKIAQAGRVVPTAAAGGWMSLAESCSTAHPTRFQIVASVCCIRIAALAAISIALFCSLFPSSSFPPLFLEVIGPAEKGSEECMALSRPRHCQLMCVDACTVLYVCAFLSVKEAKARSYLHDTAWIPLFHIVVTNATTIKRRHFDDQMQVMHRSSFVAARVRPCVRPSRPLSGTMAQHASTDQCCDPVYYTQGFGAKKLKHI